ncbi:hypothetical protein ACFL50_04615 [Candidatus Latescibacterota bacterium]
MILKRCLLGILFLFIVTTSVHAQIHGLSVIDTADPPGKGSIHIAGSTFIAESSSLYGGRLGYGISDKLLVFADLGVHDADYFDPEFLGQAGMRYTLPFNLPFDLAVRSTAIPYIASYEHYVEFTLGLLASRYLDSGSKWAIYGDIGIDRQWWELEVPFDPATAALYGQDSYVDRGNRTDISIVLGVSRSLFGSSRLFLEVAEVDEFYGCMGIRFNLK